MDENKFEITPLPKQAEFITSPATYTCMSGGFGSGKTMAGCLRALLLSGCRRRAALLRAVAPRVHDGGPGRARLCLEEGHARRRGRGGDIWPQRVRGAARPGRRGANARDERRAA